MHGNREHRSRKLSVTFVEVERLFEAVVVRPFNPLRDTLFVRAGATVSPALYRECEVIVTAVCRRCGIVIDERCASPAAPSAATGRGVSQ